MLIEGAEEEIMEKIKKSKAKNDKVVKMVEEMKKAEVKVLRDNKWQIEDNLVLKKKKIKSKSLRLEIIQLYHNIPIARYGEQ